MMAWIIELVKSTERSVGPTGSGLILPAVIADAGRAGGRRFIEFFTATIRNANTRQAYARAVGDFFAWCERHGLTLPAIEPVHVAAYIEQLTSATAAPTVKQHLAAIRMLLRLADQRRQSCDFNPAARSAAPSTSSSRARRPCSPPTRPAAARQHPARTRHRGDGEPDTAAQPDRPPRPGPDRRHGLQLRPRLRRPRHEGRGLLHRRHGGPGSACTRRAASGTRCPPTTTPSDYLDAYIEAAGIAGEKKSPLFRSIDRQPAG